MKPKLSAISLVVLASLLAPPIAAGEGKPGLVFSLKAWEGEYASEDVPGGVKSTPTLGAIYTINADGSELKRIVSPGCSVDYPVASPDGAWVYFQSRTAGDSQIFRCKRDGAEVVSLTPPDRLTRLLKPSGMFVVKDSYGAVLCADGGRMVFTVHDGRSGRVVAADADGASPRLVAPQLGYIYMARLSPDSSRVVFSGPARGYRLLIAALPDGKPTELTPDHPDCFAPQFTPDGRTIVFTRRDGDVYRVDADGKNFKRITEGNKYVEFRLSPKDTHGSTDGPDLSPDGRRVAFVAVKDGVPNVFTVDRDGKNRRQLTQRKTPCGRVRWSPDGKELAFVSFEGKYPQLFVVPAEGGEPRQLTKLDGAVYFANWIQAPRKQADGEQGKATPTAQRNDLPLPGEGFRVAGRPAFLIPAKGDAAKTKPWVWYAPTLPNLPGREEKWMFEQFRDAGIAVAGIDAGESYGSPAGNKIFAAFHDEMTKTRGYSAKPVLLGRSRGGLMTLSWAADNPDKVAAFAGIYPVCNLASYPGVAKAAGAYAMKADELQANLTKVNPVDRLAGLAKAKVPLFAIHGDIDKVVPLESNSGLVKERYAGLGGSMQLIVPKGQGHNMWSGFFQCQELVDFVKNHAVAAK